MYKYLIMLTVCAVTQRICGKSLFDYNINPDYDLVAEPSTSYSNFWSSSEFHEPHNKHYVIRRGHGKGRGKHRHELPLHSFDLSPGYIYPDSSEEDSDEIYHSPHHHHPHGLPPGQARKHGHSHGHPHGPPHDHPHGPPLAHPHDPPRRFPPPPVYDKDFINPWAVPQTTLKPVQQPPLTTPAVYVAPKLTTTTPAPVASSTTNDEGLIYDIDVRFGRD